VTGAHRAERAEAADRDDWGGVPSAGVSLSVPTADAMRTLGERLADLLRPADLVVLTGDLGAGKTTLTQGIGVGLQVRDGIASPTFVIARVHPSLAGGPALVHVDAFRLNSLAEIDDLDLDASLAESVTVVEWGHGLVEDLAPDRLEVVIRRPRGDGLTRPAGDTLSFDDDDVRWVDVTGYGRRWDGVSFPSSIA
jgi:tRNA threonylcarbamoyladenosine biosynthesis protein TsaE